MRATLKLIQWNALLVLALCFMGTQAQAQTAAEAAIAALSGIPDSAYKQALIAIAEFSVQRRS